MLSYLQSLFQLENMSPYSKQAFYSGEISAYFGGGPSGWDSLGYRGNAGTEPMYTQKFKVTPPTHTLPLDLPPESCPAS